MPELEVTLEELFNGTDKTVEAPNRTLSVRVEPGFYDGTTLSFAMPKKPRVKGSIPPEPEPPTEVVVRQKSHDMFERRGDDLFVRRTVSLSDALTGFTIDDLRTLDGRTLNVPVTTVVRPGGSVKVDGEGMPVPGGNGRRGDLHIEFTVDFPVSLDAQQKTDIKAVFSRGKK